MQPLRRTSRRTAARPDPPPSTPTTRSRFWRSTTFESRSSFTLRRRSRTILASHHRNIPHSYDARKLTLSKNFLPRHPFDNGELEVRDELLSPIPRTADAMRRELADYYATITHLDHEVGRVLQALSDRGLAANTVVIYSSDQGLAVGGRHGLMGKQNLYEHIKPPLIVAGPGVPHGRSDALVYLFDLFPTICDFAGVPTPPEVEGKSLLACHSRRDKARSRPSLRRLPRLSENDPRRALEADQIQRRR